MTEKLDHKHADDDIIIKDRDGSFKILREGKFIPLSEVESAELAAEHHLDAPKKSAPAPQGENKEQVRGMADKDLNKQAKDAISQSGVTFASNEIQNRVVKALVAHIKGIRKPFQTRENLMKPAAEGGAGLEFMDANKLLKAAGGEQPEPLRPKIDITKTKKPDSIMPPVKPVGTEVHNPTPVATKREATPAVPAPKPPVAKEPVVAPQPSVADVKKPSRPMAGLATELAYDLATWRRVASNPLDRIKKIQNQLGVLEEDRYPQRLKGIDAWRSSDVFQMYLKSGEKSLDEGKPLQEILGQGGPESLSMDEWQAISELNTLIRA